MTSIAQNHAPGGADRLSQRHAPGEAREGVLRIPGALTLHHGGRLDEVSVAWRLEGAPDAPTDGPVVLALGGISAHRCVYSSGQARGWWDELAGPGKALDSRQFRILGCDFVGGSGDSTGPRAGTNGDAAFPAISTYDQAAAVRAVMDALGIASLHAIVGASYGGMVALAFAERHPDRVERLLVIGACDRNHPQATAWRSVQRRIVRFAIGQGDGRAGLELARALAMITYRSPGEFAARFSPTPGPQTAPDGTTRFSFPVEDYLFARGADYAAHYRPEAFLCLSESIDLHAVDARAIRTPTTFVAVREDQLVPPADVHACARLIGSRARVHEIASPFGHDAFLKEPSQLAPIFTAALTGQLP